MQSAFDGTKDLDRFLARAKIQQAKAEKARIIEMAKKKHERNGVGKWELDLKTMDLDIFLDDRLSLLSKKTPPRLRA